MDELQPRDDEYRFGFTKQQILAELLDHQGLIRDGCYVPTRHEVATWPAERVYWHVIGWFWESPSSLIPNDAQIEECLAVLRARPDADSEVIQRIIAEAPPPAEGGEGKGDPRGGSSDEGEGRVIEPEEMKFRKFDRRHQRLRETEHMKTAPVPDLGIELDPIPEPPVQIRRLMLAIGTILDGFIDQDPQYWHPALLHSMVVPGADIVLAGTRCRRPLVTREVGNIARAVDRDAIIVRAAEEAKHATFDVLLRHVERPFMGYRLWIRQPLGSAWLVPTGGERTFLRLDGLGLELSPEAPFEDEIDAYRGLKAGAEYLSIAVQGWF